MAQQDFERTDSQPLDLKRLCGEAIPLFLTWRESLRTNGIHVLGQFFDQTGGSRQRDLEFRKKQLDGVPASIQKAAGNDSSLIFWLPLMFVAQDGTDLEASMCEVRDHSDHSGPDLPGRSNETCDRRLHWCQEHILLRQA
jgi:hypothetical protein